MVSPTKRPMVVRVRLGTPIYNCLERTRKGGTENGLVDHFPDAACRVRLGTPTFKNLGYTVYEEWKENYSRLIRK